MHEHEMGIYRSMQTTSLRGVLRTESVCSHLSSFGLALSLSSIGHDHEELINFKDFKQMSTIVSGKVKSLNVKTFHILFI